MHLCKLIKNKKKFLNFNLSLKKEYHNCQPDWRWPLPAQLRLEVAVMARYLAWRLTRLPSLPSLPPLPPCGQFGLVPVNKGREWRPGTLSGSSSGPGSSHTKALSSSLASRPLEYFREGARPLGYFWEGARPLEYFGEGARPDVMK